MTLETFLVFVAIAVTFVIGFRTALELVESVENKRHHTVMEELQTKHYANLEAILKARTGEEPL